MRPARLLRWYPRTWRERYGEELLALIQDTLDEGRPTWRLRLGVIWGGLRERGHQAGHAVRAAVKRWAVSRYRPTILAGRVDRRPPPGNLTTSPPPARAWQATAALGAYWPAVVAFIGAVVLASGLAALPAVVRFLRAGGWPKIRRRVAWAAGATVAAGRRAGRHVVLGRSHNSAQLSTSWPTSSVLLVTGLALVVAIGLWASAVAATARHLTLTPRVRAAQLVLGSVIPTAVSALLSADIIWYSATQSSVTWLVSRRGQSGRG